MIYYLRPIAHGWAIMVKKEEIYQITWSDIVIT